MPSTSLQDADKKLVDRYLPMAQAFKKAHAGRNLVVTCTYRSPEEQQVLFRHGRGQDERGNWIVQDAARVLTQLSGQPGHLSLHNEKPARAIDVAVCVGGKIVWDAREYFVLVELAKQFGLESGGSWPHFKDWPHLQLPTVSDSSSHGTSS